MRPSDITEYLGVYMTEDQIRSVTRIEDPKNRYTQSVLSDQLEKEIDKFRFRPKYLKKILISLSYHDPIRNSRPSQYERKRLAIKVTKENADIVRGASKRTGMSISSIIRILVASHVNNKYVEEEGAAEDNSESSKERHQEDPRQLQKLRMKALDQAISYSQQGTGRDGVQAVLSNAVRFYDFMNGTTAIVRSGKSHEQ